MSKKKNGGGGEPAPPPEPSTPEGCLCRWQWFRNRWVRLQDSDCPVHAKGPLGG